MGPLSILIYHRVLAARDPLLPGVVDRATFARQMRAVSRLFRVLPLPEAVDRLYAGTLPGRAVAVTFDDGYRDNVDEALPVLRHYGVPATFFIATGFLDGDCMWNDQVIEALRVARPGVLDLSHSGAGRYSLAASPAERAGAVGEILKAIKHFTPERREAAVADIRRLTAAPASPSLMMEEKDVRLLLDSGMEIGAHTVTHPILARLSDDEALREMDESRRRLSAIARRPVRLFAYPNGRPDEDYAMRDVRIARELGFQAAVSTAWACATTASDRFQLPRFTPWDQAVHRFVARLVAMRLRAAAGREAA